MKPPSTPRFRDSACQRRHSVEAPLPLGGVGLCWQAVGEAESPRICSEGVASEAFLEPRGPLQLFQGPPLFEKSQKVGKTPEADLLPVVPLLSMFILSRSGLWTRQTMLI